MSEQQTYLCVFCGKALPSRIARKRHNRKCDKNVNREANRARGLKVADRRTKMGTSAQDFWELHDDLPDGAFFAMAAEQGLEPEDFIDG